MENLQPVLNINPNEIPDGFTTQASTGPGAAGGANNNNAAALKKQQMEEQKQAILEQALSQEALARLGRIKLVKPEKAKAVEHQIVSLAVQGKLPGKINESKLIELLERADHQQQSSSGSGGKGGNGQAEKISIQRKKYAFDEDSDDDDNDDDLL